jgi:ribonuclease HI
MENVKYYVVCNGRKPGIYKSWKECEKQVKGFSGARYKAYHSEWEAKREYKEGKNELKKVPELIKDSICVSAVCRLSFRSNTGMIEYRGVDYLTREVIFKSVPFQRGTVNLGEFLSVVKGMKFLKREKKDVPIYTDSQVAISWIDNKDVNSQLELESMSEDLLSEVGDGIDWLEKDQYPGKILKWETKLWGSIPSKYL